MNTLEDFERGGYRAGSTRGFLDRSSNRPFCDWDSSEFRWVNNGTSRTESGWPDATASWECVDAWEAGYRAGYRAAYGPTRRMVVDFYYGHVSPTDDGDSVSTSSGVALDVMRNALNEIGIDAFPFEYMSKIVIYLDVNPVVYWKATNLGRRFEGFDEWPFDEWVTVQRDRYIGCLPDSDGCREIPAEWFDR